MWVQRNVRVVKQDGDTLKAGVLHFALTVGLAVAVVAVLLGGCSSPHRVLPISEAARLEISAVLPSPPFGEIVDAVRIDDSTFALSDVSARAIYLYSPHNSTAIQLGARGCGPGEYIAPAQLAFTDGVLYFKELTGPTIGALPLRQEQPDRVSWHLGRAIRSFCASPWGRFYALAIQECSLLEFDRQWNEEKRFCKFPESYKDVILAIHGGGVCCSESGLVYFAHTAPYRIWVADSSLNEVRLFVDTPPPDYRPFPESVLGGRIRNIPPRKRRQILMNSSRIMGVYCGAGELVFVSVSDPTSKWRALLHVYEPDGHFLCTVGLRNASPLRVQQDELIAIVPAEGEKPPVLQVFKLRREVLGHG